MAERKDTLLLAITLAGILVCAMVILAITSAKAPDERITTLFQQPQSIPAAVAKVLPAPGSAIKYSLRSDVCVGVNVEPLLEPGDAIRRIENFSLSIDGRRIPDDSLGHLTIDETITVESPQGKIGYGPPYDEICWRGVLRPGLHIVDFHVWSTSGETEFEYSWVFRVDL
jgi:hypothetical protein